MIVAVVPVRSVKMMTNSSLFLSTKPALRCWFFYCVNKNVEGIFRMEKALHGVGQRVYVAQLVNGYTSCPDGELQITFIIMFGL